MVHEGPRQHAATCEHRVVVVKVDAQPRGRAKPRAGERQAVRKAGSSLGATPSTSSARAGVAAAGLPPATGQAIERGAIAAEWHSRKALNHAEKADRWNALNVNGAAFTPWMLIDARNVARVKHSIEGFVVFRTFMTAYAPPAGTA